MMKPFCVLPFVQFSTTVSGDYQACCIAKQQDENMWNPSEEHRSGAFCLRNRVAKLKTLT